MSSPYWRPLSNPCHNALNAKDIDLLATTFHLDTTARAVPPPDVADVPGNGLQAVLPPDHVPRVD